MNDVQQSLLSGGIAEERSVAGASSRSGWLIPLVRSWGARALGVLPVVALFALFVVTGLRGIDLGFHWDEVDWHIKPVRTMVQTGILLPKSYIYPSLDKWLVMIPAAVEGVRAAISSGGDPAIVQAAMLREFDAGDYLLRVRAVFLVVGALAIFWTYGAALALRYRRWEAFVAASAIALSWEYNYHARYAVTDCVLVQFTALTMFMLALFHRTGKPEWLKAASVAAGLGMGTKYPGVILLVWVLVAGALALPRTAYVAQLKRVFSLGFTASLVYLLTTPGMLLEPIVFVTDTRMISNYYATVQHGGHTMSSGWTHTLAVLEYFGFCLFSGYQALALPMFVLAVVGAALWVKRDWRFSTFLVGFPCLFLLMFCSKYRVMIARNYLFLMPCLAILMARTLGDIVRWLPKRPLRWVFAAGLLAAGVLQVVFLIKAAESIRDYDQNRYVREALNYIDKRSDTKFRISGRVRASARAQHLTLPKNVVGDSAPAGEVLFWASGEGPGAWHFSCNDPWLTQAIFGPLELNFNWYTGWAGRDRLIVMTMEKARATNVALAR
jgi:hypothetical protein